MGLPLLTNLLNFRFMRKDIKPVLRVNVSITGAAEDVISDLSRFSPKKSDSLIRIKIKAKAADGQWIEDYELPVINGPNTIPAKQALERLYRQARISKEQYAEADKAIDRLGNCANETGIYSDRYEKKSMGD